MHCLSNLHTNNHHMTSDKMNKPKGQIIETPKMLCKTSTELLAVQAVTLPC